MSIMDIGILTGFKPDQKSLQKVGQLSNYIVKVLDVSVLLRVKPLFFCLLRLLLVCTGAVLVLLVF